MEKNLPGTIILFVFIHQANKLHIEKKAHKGVISKLTFEALIYNEDFIDCT